MLSSDTDAASVTFLRGDIFRELWADSHFKLQVVEEEKGN